MARSDCPLCWIEAHVGNPDGAFEVDEWLRTATCVRDNLLGLRRKLKGLCAEASYVTAYLIGGSVVLGEYRFEGRPSEENLHYWVEKGGYIIDPTVEQYGEFDGPIVTKVGDKHFHYTDYTFRDSPVDVRAFVERSEADQTVRKYTIRKLLEMECPLVIGAHIDNPGNPESLTIAEQVLIEMTAEEGKRVDVPSVCLEHGDFLKLQEKGLVYTLQPIRHGHLIWWRLTEEGERIARELGFKVK